MIKTAANNLLHGIRATSRPSPANPKYRTLPELRDQGISQYRELVIPLWRVIYRISEKAVYVLAVFDSRQNIEDILLKRLIDSKI